jgi:O-glycosyl hydrolase
MVKKLQIILLAIVLKIMMCGIAMAAFNGDSIVTSKSQVYKDATAWYSFDIDGTDSIGDNHLSLSHVTFVDDAVRGKVALINHADTGYMEFTKPAISGEQFTIATWFYYFSAYKEWWQTIFEFASDVTNSNFYFCPNFGSLGMVSENKTDSKWESIGTNNYQTPTDTWIHLAVTFDNGKVTIYANGNPVGSGDFTNTIAGLGLNRYFIGANPLPARFYRALDAMYDDFATYDKVLNDKQIYALAYDTLPVPPEGPPYVMEAEDYAFGTWDKGSDGDTAYAISPVATGDQPDASDALLYGVIKTDGQLSVWARVKTSVLIKSPFSLQLDDGQWYACDSIMPSENWQWILLRRLDGDNKQSHTLKIAPIASGVKTDKFLFTYNWLYMPDSDYLKTDITNPSVPNNLSVKNVTEYTATLGWNSSADTDGVTAYDILDGNKVIMAVVDTTAQPVLQAATAFNFSVRAKDGAGNISALSDPVSANTKKLTFTADYIYPKQTMHHFGSSDAWSVEFIGLWPDAKRDSLAQLLFSNAYDANGNPRGIALSNWRYRIGDGSLDQSNNGLASGNWFKATHCFLKPDGSYDWTKQAGNMYFVKKAKAYGVPHFTGWTDSPPYFMTKSGYVFRVTGVTQNYNLNADKYDDYANYLATVANHLENEGIHLDVVSPVNEPQWTWDGTVGNASQPGSYCTNAEMAGLVKAINTAFVANNVTSKILISEAGALDYLYTGNAGVTGDQINTFWNPSSASYIGNQEALSNYVSGHGYFTETTVASTISNRQSLLSKMQSVNPLLEYWQTEYSLLSEGYSKEKANMDPIDYSLFIARIIHYDLTVANCTGWDWWSTFSRAWAKDHFYRFALINWYPNVDNAGCNDGTFLLTKNLWTIGNFSHFVRPGYKRLSLNRSDFLTAEQSANKQLVSAYVSPAADTIVYVVINYAAYDQHLTLKCNNLPLEGTFDELKPYVTSATDDLKAYPAVDATQDVTVMARSVTTFVGKINKTAGLEPGTNDNLTTDEVLIYPNPASGKVFVTLMGKTGCNVTILNISGQKEGTFIIRDNYAEIDISRLKEGCYVLRFEDGEKINYEKLVIEK